VTGTTGGAADGLLERGHELDAITRAVAEAQRGSGSLVVVEGPAGIGKSRLLAAARRCSPGMRGLAALGGELDRAGGYRVASHLLGAAVAGATGPRREALFDGQARLARPLFEGRAVPEGVDVVRGLYWLTVNLVATGPVLLVVDDAQWADRGSLRFVLHLAARLEELALVVLVAVRSGPAPEVGDLLDGLRGLPHATVLHPAPLSIAAVGALLARELGEPAPAFARACTTATGGNPFLVRELAHTLRSEGLAPTDEATAAVQALVPATVTRSVLSRLARVSTAARRLATAVAVLGGRSPLTRAAELAELSGAEAERAADELVGAHVLDAGDPLVFTHPLVGSAVHGTVAPFALARAHHRAARLLAAEAAPDSAVAAHLVLTRPHADPAVVTTLRAAAATALGQGDPRTAVRLLCRARMEDPTGPQRFELLLELADAEAQAGDVVADERIAEALRIATEPADVVRALIVRARVCYTRADHAGTVEASEAALALLDPADPVAESVLAGALAAGVFHGPSRVRTAPRMAEFTRAARAGRVPDNPALLAHLALRFVQDGEPAERVHAVAERALADDPLGDAAAHGRPFSLVVQALVAVDLLAEAEAAADRAVASARQRGSVIAYALATYHRAIPRYHRGALVDALTDVEQGHAAKEEGWLAGSAWEAELLVLVHLARDELPAARRRIELGAGAPRDTMDHPVMCYARAQLALAEGRAADALADALEAGRVLAHDYDMDHPGLFPWRPVAAVAAHALGETDRAEGFAAEAVAQARALGVARITARALRARARVGPAADALDLLTEAVGLLEASPARLEQTAALVDLGRAQRRRGDTGPALHTLRRAYEQAGAMKAEALARHARHELRALGVRPRRAALTGVDALTTTERRVAELAASGLTNTQVAQALFVTPKTVESHLARTYRKLRITTRRALATALAEQRSPTTSCRTASIHG
jgi:DNA-binding CsgD family transcriptional regulator/tetratricopeptide (TPR) repeat protein